MFHLFVWKWDAILLDTFSSYALAKEALTELQKIDPERKMWIEPVVCRDDVAECVAKFKRQYVKA